jgi:hypothetical protein
MFEVLITKFSIQFGKLQIQGYHGQQEDPRRHKTVSPTNSKSKNLRKDLYYTSSSLQSKLQENRLASKFGFKSGDSAAIPSQERGKEYTPNGSVDAAVNAGVYVADSFRPPNFGGQMENINMINEQNIENILEAAKSS